MEQAKWMQSSSTAAWSSLRGSGWANHLKISFFADIGKKTSLICHNYAHFCRHRQEIASSLCFAALHDFTNIAHAVSISTTYTGYGNQVLFPLPTPDCCRALASNFHYFSAADIGLGLGIRNFLFQLKFGLGDQLSVRLQKVSQSDLNNQVRALFC